MWLSSMAVSAAAVTWIFSTVVSGITTWPEVDGEGGVYIEPAPILPLEKRTTQDQDPCTYFTQNYGRECLFLSLLAQH